MKTPNTLISSFIRHRYWFNQGTNVMASTSVLPLEKVAVVAGVGKYLFGDHVSPVLLYTVIGGYFVWRLVSRWLIGWYWHRHDGYTVETNWNRGKIPPGRVEVINVDELATAMYKLRSENIADRQVYKAPTV